MFERIIQVRRSRRISLYLSGIFLFSGLAFQGRSSELSRASLLPADSGIVIEIKNTTEFIDDLKKSPAGRLLKSEKMQRLMKDSSPEDIVRNIFFKDQKDEEKARLLGHLAYEQLRLIKGEVSIGMRYEGKDYKGIAAVFETDRKDFLEMIEYDRRMLDVKYGSNVNQYQFQDVDIYHFSESAGSTAKKKEKETVQYQAFVDGTGIVSNERPWLEKTIMKLKENSIKKASQGPFKIILKRKLINAFFKDKKSGKAKQAVTSEKVACALGLTDFKDIHISLWPSYEDISVKGLLTDLSTDPSGIWKLIPDRACPRSLRLPYVPESVSTYQVMNFDFSVLSTLIPEILNRINPALIFNYNAFLYGTLSETGVDLNRDVFDALGSVSAGFSQMDNNIDRKLFGIQLADAETMEKTLEKLLGPGSCMKNKAGQFLKSEKFLGYNVYMLDVDAVKGSNLPPGSRREMGVAVVKDMVFIGDGRLLRNTIRSAASGENAESVFYSSEKFAEFMKIVPENAVQFTFIDGTEYWSELFRAIRQRMPAGRKKLEDMDMPDPDFIANFMSLIAVYMDYKGKGFEAVLKIMSPREKKQVPGKFSYEN